MQVVSALWRFDADDPEWRADFPDWDCRRNPRWNGFFSALEQTGLTFSGSLENGLGLGRGNKGDDYSLMLPAVR